MEEYRRTTGDLGTQAEHGIVGVFIIPRHVLLRNAYAHTRKAAQVLSDDGTGSIEGTPRTGWEHVSVSIIDKGNGKNRTPYWGEMCAVKDLFWKEDERVVQYHPKEEEYANTHPHVLHMWRPIDEEIPMPPTQLVAPKPS